MLALCNVNLPIQKENNTKKKKIMGEEMRVHIQFGIRKGSQKIQS